MIYLLDTSVPIILMKPARGLITRLRNLSQRDFGVSSLVAHELFYGAYKGQRTARSLAQLATLKFSIVEFDEEDARRAGEIRAHLANAGKPIGIIDTLIAGQAVARSLTLITHNVREFSRVPELRIEDWQA